MTPSLSLRGPELLKGKRCLVTGGSRGLGRALVEVFSASGARVAFTYRKNTTAAEETLDAVRSAGAEPLAFQANVLDGAAMRKTIKDVEEAWEGIDILVNNAGITQNLPLALLDEEDWDRVMDTNMKGTFMTTRAVIRGMIRRKSGGVILNIGSLAGMRAIDAPIHYCASKAAMKGFTESLSKELSRYRIRVNCLAPGLLEDGVGRNLPEHRLEDYLNHCAMGRVGTFAEVAEFAAFLVSDGNSYMNGETILMDGGL